VNLSEVNTRTGPIGVHADGIFLPVTRRVKGYTRIVGKYLTGRRKLFRPFQWCHWNRRRIWVRLAWKPTHQNRRCHRN